MNKLINNRGVIIEPSPVVRMGIKRLLEENGEHFAILDFCDLQSFEQSTKESVFDLIMVNPSLINLYKKINVRSLFIDYPNAPLIAIAYGYVNRETLSSFDGVLDIYDDGAEMTRKLKGIVKAFGNNQNSVANDSVDLSDREKEILISVAKGLTNKEIGDRHSISVHTVISHRKNITRKIGIRTVSGLTIYAIYNNLISQDDL